MMTQGSDLDRELGRLVDRRFSDSVKWRLYDSDVLPMWVADMDFLSPEPVIRALRERVDHGVFGYGKEPSELRPVIVERLRHLYGWQVAKYLLFPVAFLIFCVPLNFLDEMTFDLRMLMAKSALPDRLTE